VLDVTTHNGSGQTESISSRCLAEIVARGIRDGVAGSAPTLRLFLRWRSAKQVVPKETCAFVRSIWTLNSGLTIKKGDAI